MDSVKIGSVEVSRFLLGSNPFSGFSHQSVERDREMMHYFTSGNIKKTIADAERLGITGMVARSDFHVIRCLMEYWDEGGKIKWFAQTCPEVGPTENCVKRLKPGGASACHVHGGVVDHLVSQKKYDELKRGVDAIRKQGIPAGIAGHNVRIFEWAEKELDCDYYMCCYYNPIPREDDPEHRAGTEEKYLKEDREAMADIIRRAKVPVIHYKVLAAGRNDPEEAFAYAARTMRDGDLVCVGVYPADDKDMLKKDVGIFGRQWAVSRKDRT
jgi:hypothetical protein